MKKPYTEEQIAFALKQAELGTPPQSIIRKMGICQQIFYSWKIKYAGMGVKAPFTPQANNRVSLS